jgi:hypothetical protein
MLVVSRNFYKDVRIIWNLLVLFITINSQTYLFSSPSTLNRTDAAPYKKRPSEKFHESTSNEKISLASNICPFQAQQSALRAPSIPIEVPYTPSSSFFLRLCLHIDPQRYMVRESSRINLKRENQPRLEYMPVSSPTLCIACSLDTYCQHHMAILT